MKDLYRRNKLKPREEDHVNIHNCEGSDEDKEAAFTILLNAHKKAEYDRAHATLSTIGYVRRHLGLAGSSNWRRRYGDFLQPTGCVEVTGRQRRKRQQPGPGLRLPHPHWPSLISWPLVITVCLSLVPLAYLTYRPDGPQTVAQDRNFNTSMHSLHPNVAVHTLPDSGSPTLVALAEFQDVDADPRQSDNRWVYVKVSHDIAGYVRGKHLAFGSGDLAQVMKCRPHGIWRPETGQRLAPGRLGRHILTVENPPGRDALVKLKDHEGNTQVFFYVRSGESATVATIPEGRFQLHYALGENYSPACGRFLDHMQALSNPRFITFSARAEGLAGARSAVIHRLKTAGSAFSSVPNSAF